MSYDPFKRGNYPVGVCTIETGKEPRSGRSLTVEVWYPATEAYRGKDTAGATMDRFTIGPGLAELIQEAVRDAAIAATVRLPLVVYFHGGYGFRREMANVTAHLASHGYIVAAPDFPGDGIADLQLTEKKDEPQTFAPDESALVRPHQASFVISGLITDSPFASVIDSDKIGTFGLSMGGFTSLGLNSIDARPKATVAIAPLYGENEMVRSMSRTQKQLSVDDWGRKVPTLLLAGGRDSFVLLERLRELSSKLREPKRFVMLPNAGHFHWTTAGEQMHELFRTSFLSGAITDPEFDAKRMAEAMRPFSELAPASHAADTARALSLAHFDENLKGSREAKAFLDGGVKESFAKRGIDLAVEIRKETVGA
jgi:predicted dienelactone hydrolase